MGENMITVKDLKELFGILGYKRKNNQLFVKTFKRGTSQEFSLFVDIDNEKFIYPDGVVLHRETTTNFSEKENFVVFELVSRLFDLGYQPKNIELEFLIKIGRGEEKVIGWADVLIRDNSGQPYAIIEAKTYGASFDTAWKKTLIDGDQLFSYVNQLRTNKNIPYGILYSSDLIQGDLIRKYYLITFQDNKEFIKEQNKNSKRKLYLNTSNQKELFDVWKETYNKDFSPIGMFEDKSKPFAIMEKRYTIEDISKNVLNTEGLIHQFRTILRQHNVAGYENAFDRLLNLLLAKIVDEKQSEQSGRPLDFYWRGIAFDDKKALVDRLQRLYRDGMRDYLKEDVTYIDRNDVDNAFILFKNDKDATKELIQDYFDKLKFYTDNFFAFIDVYNETLFEKNFEVLSLVVKLFQDISLTNSNQQQFLGDLFEKLLDQGVKQSEGQFFTPLPIVKFLLYSLPIREMIEKGEIPKIIDIASGSGHFLTEYVNLLKSIVGKQNDLPKYFENIYGIEKESRLAKVSKISTLMYGAGESKIFFHDALCKFNEIEENSFDIVVTNPPYSVTGFIETLSEEDKKNFELTKCIGNFASSKAIETFFLERIKQLLRPGGFAAIILPSSILQKNENIYVNVRKQILSFFDIIAIFESAGGTFGKTGTTTDTLFLRKKNSSLNFETHCKNRVISWYNKDFNKDELFDDKEKLERFAIKMNKTVNDVLGDDNYKERLTYYLLSECQLNDVQIIKTPVESESLKTFLGYGWSDRKGSEGIRYLNKELNTLISPLYNPDNIDDETKINSAIKNNYLNKKVDNTYIENARLSDLISWNSEVFDLAIDINKTKVTENIILKKGERLVSLGDKKIFSLNIGKRVVNSQLVDGGKIPVYSANVSKPFGYINTNIIEDFSLPSVIWGIDGDWQVGYIKENLEFYPTDHIGYLRVLSEDIHPRYIVNLIKEQGEKLGFSRSNRASMQKMKKIQIVVPAFEEQLKVVAELEEIDLKQQQLLKQFQELKTKEE